MGERCGKCERSQSPLGEEGEFCPWCISSEMNRVLRKANEAITMCTGATKTLAAARKSGHEGQIRDALESVERACMAASAVVLPKRIDAKGRLYDD